MRKNSRSYQKSGRRHQHTDFDQPVRSYTEADLEEILAETESPLLLILDQVQDPHNLGACLRTANAAGVNAILIPKNKSVAITETVRRVACGAAEVTPVVSVTNLARTMEKLKADGIWLVGTSDQAEQSIYGIDLTGPLGIVLGAEGSGMRRLTTENCDFLAQIPMFGTVECLNVSVSAGVCLFEALRQRMAASLPSAP